MGREEATPWIGQTAASPELVGAITKEPERSREDE
jgi:hypothetical protein